MINIDVFRSGVSFEGRSIPKRLVKKIGRRTIKHMKTDMEGIPVTKEGGLQGIGMLVALKIKRRAIWKPVSLIASLEMYGGAASLEGYKGVAIEYDSLTNIILKIVIIGRTND